MNMKSFKLIRVLNFIEKFGIKDKGKYIFELCGIDKLEKRGIKYKDVPIVLVINKLDPRDGPKDFSAKKHFIRALRKLNDDVEFEYDVIKAVTPMWDNEARKPNKGMGFIGSTPEKYQNWLNENKQGQIKTLTLMKAQIS